MASLLTKIGNDLLSDPQLILKDWNTEKYGVCDLNEILKNLDQVIEWKCSECGLEWSNTVARKIKRKKCPFCEQNRVIVGKDDLATLRPDLAEEWDYEKNGALKPTQVKLGSNRYAHWICKTCHGSYKTVIGSRGLRNSKCPYCQNKKALKGMNDLQTKNPELAKELVTSRNNGITAEDVTEFSHKRLWWECKKCGGQWQTSVANRSNNTKCPFCGKESSNILVKGKNDLATVDPEVAKEWHPTKNTLSPSDVVANSKEYFWWRCPKCGVERQARVRDKHFTGACNCMGNNNRSRRARTLKHV